MSTIVGESFELLPNSYKKFLEPRLIPIRKQTLNWEYGENEPYEAWVFADFLERNVGAAYCLGGFGSLGSPWGLIYLDVNNFGMDCGWYRSLEDLVADGWLEDATQPDAALCRLAHDTLLAYATSAP